MVRRSLPLILLVSAACLGQDAAEMESVVRHYGDHQAFMGSVLVTKAGQPLFETSYGSANVERRILNTAETKFRIASISKQFTAAAILLLEERGLVNIDHLLSEFLPDTAPAWNSVTIRHLLNHTSGVPNYERLDGYKSLLVNGYTPERLLAMLKGRELDFQPGSKYAYSNSGYFLLGRAIETVSRQTYAQFLKENLFDPLGMADTGVDDGTPKSDDFAVGYQRSSDLEVAPYFDINMFLGSGSLYSTTHDLARWTWSLRNGSVLSSASLEKMRTPALNNYGLGVSIDSEGGRTRIWHTGSLDGFNTALAFYPESQVVVVGLSNLADTGVRDISRELAALAHGERTVTRRGIKSVVWLDRAGKRLDRAPVPRGAYEGLALEPDGERLALTIWRGGSNWDVRIWDPADGVMSEVASNPEYDGFPVWSPDGEELAFSSGVPRQIYRKSSLQDGGAQQLTDGSRPPKFVLDWSPDGKYLLYRELGPTGGWDLLVLPLEGDRTPIPLVRTELSTGSGTISPDGDYLVYTADNSGRIELYLQELPATGKVTTTTQLITTDGGYDMHWRADGSELYYCRPDDGAVMVVEFEKTESGITASAPRILFSYDPNAGFDVTPDGQQFVLLVAPDSEE